MKKSIKTIFKFFLLLLVAGIIFIPGRITALRRQRVILFLLYSRCPETKTALLLGTGKI
jgi:SanA protein